MSRSSVRLLAARARHRWRRRLPALIVGLGTLLLCAGVATLFATDHGARSAFLLSLGVALVLAGLLGGRVELESFEILGAKVRVREVVKQRLDLASSPDHGQGIDADALRRQAATLQELVGLYGLYEHVRRMEPPGPERTRTLDQLASRMQSAGRTTDFDTAEVAAWFHQGTDALRVIALNLMLANEEHRDFLAVLESIDAPRSLFEQFYGLVLAEAWAPGLDSLQRSLLGNAICRARGKRRFRQDDDLMALSDHLLGRLEEH